MGARKETTSSTNVSRLNTSSHRKSKGDGSRNRAKPNVESEVDPEELDSPVPRKKARMIADNIDTEIPNVASPIPTDLDEMISDAPASPQASVTTKRESSKKKTTASEETAEKRLRRFRGRPPRSYYEIKQRAVTQRMFVIHRTRTGTDSCPEELVDIAGTTGNVYQVHIKQVPSCSCPHAQKGNQCKHIIYVLIRVLKAREELQYQLAFLSSELRQIFSNAPAILSGDSSKNQKRKPIEDDCPICCMEFEPDHEEIVYCQSACGNNVHKECFDQWASSRQKDGSDITCPFCRSRWVEADEAKIRQLAAEGETNKDGYVNIAQQLGISGRRDFNSYHPYWVRRQQQNGADVGDWDSPFDY